MERSRWINGPKYISFSNRYNDGPEIMRREVKLNYTNYGICVQVVGNMHLFVIMWPSVELCRFMQLFLTYSWMILNIFQLQTAVVIFKILLLLHFCTLFYVKVYSVYFHFPQFCSSWIFFLRSRHLAIIHERIKFMFLNFLFLHLETQRVRVNIKMVKNCIIKKSFIFHSEFESDQTPFSAFLMLVAYVDDKIGWWQFSDVGDKSGHFVTIIKNIARQQWYWWQCRVGDFMRLTNLRCWWQKKWSLISL